MRALLLTSLLVASLCAAQDVVTWTDADGVEHFTNDAANIPEQYRAKAKGAKAAPLNVITVGDDAPKEAAPVVVSDPAVSMIYFEGNPCPPCEALKKAGTLQKLIDKNPGLSLNTVDAEKNVPTMHKYGVRITPTVVFVDAQGTALSMVQGLQLPGRYDKAFKQALEKARAAK